MPNYYVNEAMFVLPARGFRDRTVHVLESPLSGVNPLTVSIRRQPLAEGKSLRELVDEEITATTAEVEGFTILDEAEVAVADAPAILLRTRWRAEDTVHYRLQAHAAVDGNWIVFVVTGPYADRAACDETFDRIVHSLAWRSD